MRVSALLLTVLGASIASAATFGTVVPITGSVSDLVLDEARNRLYLVNTTTDEVLVYSTLQRRFLDPIRVEDQPLAAAISRDGRFLYVTCHLGNSLNVINLDQLQVSNRIGLPARPQGVAVGYDERVLISTVGTGTGNQFNVLLIYDPAATGGAQALTPVPVSPPPGTNPLTPQQSLGRGGLVNRSFLAASADGRWIAGANIPNANSEVVFLYEAASGTVLRSRRVTGVSPVLSMSPSGDRFLAGLTLFDASDLTVLAQQNAANSPYPLPNGANFNLQQNQGGSVFTPDGSRLYTAFNFAPVTNPATRANVSQLMLNDPDNLLIDFALQMPENIAGKMVISSDGRTIYALSESGIVVAPVGTMMQSPVATLATNTVLLTNDQCGVFGDTRSQNLLVRNAGAGRITASLSLLQTQANANLAGNAGLGGAGGPGGGAPGALPIIIVAPPGAAGGGAAATGRAAQITGTAPVVRATNTAQGANLQFTYNSRNLGIGTVSPFHQYVVQSNEAINIPPTVRVFQNNRNSDSRSDIMPIATGLSAAEGLVDIVQDANRRRIYVANSGMNRVEVFDQRTHALLAPIKVGQLPRSLALTPDGATLYVANSGSESITIIDTAKLEVVGRIRFPATPFNATVAPVRPQALAFGQRGLLVVMTDGTIWRVIGNEATPRQFNTQVIPANNQGVQILTAPRTMAASPNGEVILVLAGNGFVYLYDANQDDFVQARQITSGAIRGYFGPISAGPRGQYFLVNGLVLNQALTPVADAGQIATGNTAGSATNDRPVSAVAAIGLTSFARFTPAFLNNANQLLTERTPPTVELVNATNYRPTGTAPAVERPVSAPTGNQRANVDGRTMVVDTVDNMAYALTASGLSMIPLAAQPAASRPSINPNGIVDLANYQTKVAFGGLFSIFGANLGESAAASSTPLPTRLGGMCVTVNDVPVPLQMTSPSQINAQIPQTATAGRFQVVVRNLGDRSASVQRPIDIQKYAPAVLADPSTQRAYVFHADGSPVTANNPAKRDRPITLYAIGLGPTKGPRIGAGDATPADEPSLTDKVEVYFGDPRYNGAEIIVEWSGLVPGYVGLYQLNLRVPGNHLRGEALPITLKIGNVTSASEGPVVPTIAVD
ncbi:MAG: beta-propeller fold lactonase family protein [Bryobacteraceae bacterium]